MNIDEARLEFIDIKENLNKILDEYHKNSWLTEDDETRIKEEIRKLYNRYLKISVCLDKKVPNFNNGAWPYENNCYGYAMNYKKPKIYQKLYTDIFYEGFFNSIGSVGNVYLPSGFTKEELLDAFYADLDALKIRSYECSMDDTPTHGGYKIAIYIHEKYIYNRSDYHFIRQNSNGIWSSKNGTFGGIFVINDPYNPEKYTKYEHVKTLEIVKPHLSEIKPSKI